MSVIVSHLSKVYGNQKVVNDISFEAKPGTILGFLGPNGAGKTTTMKMLCCYTKPESGTASVQGFDIGADPLQVRKQIGYLPENNPLYDEMYVKEYLSFVADIHKIPNKLKRIAEVIEMTGLGVEQNKIIGTLSKGYRQRVGLAQAIIHDPKVLFLDEPSSGLDMNQLQDIRSLIRELGKSKTVVFSSHIMQEVEALCDQVVIINKGTIVANEHIDHLRSRMQGTVDITVELASVDDAKNYLTAIDGVIKVSQNDRILSITSQSNVDIRSHVFRKVVEKGNVILEMRRDKANFEDVFRQLTKSEQDV
jgi:ABC-2 type transport system ATP-binding protein